MLGNGYQVQGRVWLVFFQSICCLVGSIFLCTVTKSSKSAIIICCLVGGIFLCTVTKSSKLAIIICCLVGGIFLCTVTKSSK